MDQEKIKSRPSSSLFQIARGSGATLKTLEITKSVKTTVHTELFMRRRQEPGKHSTDQESLSRQRTTPSCLHGKDEGQTSTRQIKKGCQHKDNMQSCLHSKDESKTKYSASQITLITWTTHPKNKQGIQAEKTSTKNLYSKRSIMSYYEARA